MKDKLEDAVSESVRRDVERDALKRAETVSERNLWRSIYDYDRDALLDELYPDRPRSRKL